MGADINTTVFRINQKQLPDFTNMSGEKAVTLFDKEKLTIHDFEFSSNIPVEIELDRSYALFSFLSGVRGNIKPIVNVNKLQEITETIVAWITPLYNALPSSCKDKSLMSPLRRSIYKDTTWNLEFEDMFDIGDHSRVIYPLYVLNGFDYDQVALIEDEKSSWDNPQYYPDTNGWTYRRYFGDQLHEFLDWGTDNNWQYVMFGFDS